MHSHYKYAHTEYSYPCGPTSSPLGWSDTTHQIVCRQPVGISLIAWQTVILSTTHTHTQERREYCYCTEIWHMGSLPTASRSRLGDLKKLKLHLVLACRLCCLDRHNCITPPVGFRCSSPKTKKVHAHGIPTRREFICKIDKSHHLNWCKKAQLAPAQVFPCKCFMCCGLSWKGSRPSMNDSNAQESPPSSGTGACEKLAWFSAEESMKQKADRS